VRQRGRLAAAPSGYRGTLKFRMEGSPSGGWRRSRKRRHDFSPREVTSDLPAETRAELRGLAHPL